MHDVMGVNTVLDLHVQQCLQMLIQGHGDVGVAKRLGGSCHSGNFTAIKPFKVTPWPY